MHILTFKEPEWLDIFEPCTLMTPYEITSWFPESQMGDFRRIMEKHKPRAVGLAAPQVGIFKRFFATHLDGVRRFYFNPTWTPTPNSTIEYSMENCFSFPGDAIKVGRQTEIEVFWTDLEGRLQGPKVLKGWEARVFQHEHAHLEGKPIFPKTWTPNFLKKANVEDSA